MNLSRLGSVVVDPCSPVVAGSTGQWIITLTVGPASQAVAFDLPLAHGYNALQFRSREAPLQPSREEGLADNRALSVALADVHISGP